jgi:site-specific DNA-methyltransferase (adenine-specific)
MNVPMTEHYINISDTRTAMKMLADGSMQLVVTSPPYGSLKNYEHPGQIGFSHGYEQYLSELESVWRECLRVLEPGCKLVINVGDQFFRGTVKQKYSVLPIQADTITICRRLGFETLGSIIWKKVSTTKTSGGGVWMGSIYYPRDGYVTYEHEYILLFRKPGKYRQPSKKLKELSKLTKEQRSLWFRGIWELKPARQNGHCAMFPKELPERIIRMYSFAGDTVLDPFLGSGTTMEAARDWGRNSVGIELNPAFVPLIRERIGEAEQAENGELTDACGNRYVLHGTEWGKHPVGTQMTLRI